jgi:hypothetical protein
MNATTAVRSRWTRFERILLIVLLLAYVPGYPGLGIDTRETSNAAALTVAYSVAFLAPLGRARRLLEVASHRGVVRADGWSGSRRPWSSRPSWSAGRSRTERHHRGRCRGRGPRRCRDLEKLEPPAELI